MSTHLAPAPGSTTIELALKIWRYDAETGDKKLERYEVEAPDWVTLLDVLDLIKDRVDGSLAYRKSCRMMPQSGLSAAPRGNRTSHDPRHIFHSA